MSDDLISRQAAIEALGEMPEVWEEDDDEGRGEQNQWYMDKTAIEAVPIAEQCLDEWCTNCKEYDHRQHCCPRFNRVIRETVEELKVVRCGECIYYNAEERLCNDLMGFGRYWEPWNYCSYGERRSDD